MLNENIQGDDREQNPRFLSSTADDVGANWSDHSRDLLYMVNIFRDRMVRPIFGIGHSVGSPHLSVNMTHFFR